MKKKINLLKSAILASSIFTMGTISAASDGLLDIGTTSASSEGEVVISIAVPYFIHITGLADYAFLQYDPASPGDKEITHDFCVRSNAATFRLNLEGDNAGFIMDDDPTSTLGPNQIAYSVELATRSDTGVYGTYAATPFGDSSPISEQRKAVGCFVGGSAENNVSMKVKISQVVLDDAAPATYQDTLVVIAETI